MAESVFMKADEVAEALGVSKTYAYKLIRKLNAELKDQGCIVLSGRIDRKFFYEHLYGGQQKEE
ncbi:MAG: DNA-binding protein [Oscillospiraceae bacterium]|nr:DNA-binding protein [Oscillospiraceae bacterium]